MDDDTMLKIYTKILEGFFQAYTFKNEIVNCAKNLTFWTIDLLNYCKK